MARKPNPLPRNGRRAIPGANERDVPAKAVDDPDKIAKAHKYQSFEAVHGIVRTGAGPRAGRNKRQRMVFHSTLPHRSRGW